MGSPVVVEGLSVVAGSATLVDALSFRIQPGEVLALIGESGSGKTTTALALMGHARHGCRIAAGQVRIGDTDVLQLDAAGLRALRGRRVTYIAQSAAASFDPSRTLIDQVIEPALLHGTLSREQARAKALALFAELALPDPPALAERYPHQVSGGQLQRAMAAMALITDPEVVILDEPTTALDVTTQIEVLRAFRRVVRERQVTAVYVSHDLAVVAQMADHILVMHAGRRRELQPTQALLTAPQDDYTRSLLAAAHPVVAAAPVDAARPLLLQVQGVSAGYGRARAGDRPPQVVLDSVSLQLHRGQALGVIGESGSGKTTLARVIAGLHAPFAGELRLDGRVLPPRLEQRDRETLRRVQIVVQSADTALNPAHTVAAILARPLQFYRGLQGAALARRVDELLDLVRLPRTLAARLPAGLSGGQRQRVNLARALAAEPELLLCDEVTSALDTVVGAAVLALIAELRRALGLSVLFISHDLNTVRAFCDDIVVMRHGRQLAQIARDAYEGPAPHPYYEQLRRAVPQLRRGWLDEVDAAPPDAA
ncbi:MAG: ABC transporter ATP-binding protein [Rubrivivax sp.]